MKQRIKLETLFYSLNSNAKPPKKLIFNMVVYILLGASASLLLALAEIKKLQNRKIKTHKLKMIGEALKQAEERLIISAERHDRILDQICSSYLINQNLEEALATARDTMNRASELTIALGKMQLETINSYTYCECETLLRR